MIGIVVLTKDYVPEIIKDIMELDDDSRFDGFFCLRLDPTVCGCGHLQEYFEPIPFHAILVWENKDDDVLLAVADEATKQGQDARIVEYKQEFGAAIEFDEALNLGMLG